MRPLLFLLFATCLVLRAEDVPDAGKEAPTPVPPPAPVTRDGSVTIGGRTIDYQVTTAKLQLKKDDGTPRASIFHVSYLRQGVEDLEHRPVLFAFNGGPGSSAVWLHLGLLGPRRIAFPGDGTTAPEPPSRLVANEFSLLDVADLVFVDPVSTGYSRAEKDVKPNEFHGVSEDIVSLGDFIRLWITEHRRWSSPKYLLGESYGGIRVAGLSEHLQSRYGMSLNGTILLSSLLDFRTLSAAEGDPLSYQVFLPAYTAVAHHHGKLQGDRDALVEQAREFAFGDYGLALLEGNRLGAARRQELAGRMAALTGIDAAVLEQTNLRLDPSRFRVELLRKEGKVLGRFDGRVAWPAGDPSSDWPDYDPSLSLALGPFSTAMLSHLTENLGWEEDSPYEILTGKTSPWNMGRGNNYVNVSDDLAAALRDNPHLRVLVMEGACDLATPADGIDYSIRQMINTPPAALARIERARYQAGHMFYLNPPDLAKAREDLVRFITSN